MGEIIKFEQVIESYISGDWGNDVSSDEAPCSVSCIRGADIIPIRNSDFSNIPIRYISSRSLAAHTLQEGDIVIEKSGGSPTQSTGRVVYISKELLAAKGDVVCSNFCVAFRVKAEWNPKYIYYYLCNIYNADVFFNFEGKTSGLKNLQVEAAFKAIPIKKIAIEEQASIANTLSIIESKLAVNRQINDNLEAMAKQLYDYWFVQFDFPNEEGKPYKSSGGKMVWNDKLKQEIPEGWEVDKVSSLIEPIERGISYASADLLDDTALPMINLACFSKNGDYRTGEMKYYSGIVPGNKYVQPMDMLIACTDMTQGADIIGRPILASHEFNQYTFSTDLAAIRPKSIAKMYLYYTLRTPFYHKYIRPFASGTNVKHLNIAGVENYIITVPTDTIQLEFEKTIAPIKEKQSKILNEIALLTKQRDELLPLLMNGQVSVNYHLSDD